MNLTTRLSAILTFAHLSMTALSTTLLPRQSDVCLNSGQTCAGNAEPCGSACICIDPFDTGRGECVPASCVAVRCNSTADCCASPLPFVCLIAPGEPDPTPGICAPSLPPGDVSP
ncbi:hypothetical protein BV20DRAFT_1054190 [Pilatotrama ljubarskyi]|nr:hypothetical protein BV20DRAFT_1054190 [Pilatotrama ljubarskyi]